MEVTDQNLTVLRDLLTNSLSHDNTTRRQAESILTSQEAQRGFSLLILSLINRLNTPTAPSDAGIRQGAAVLFKNVVKRKWNPDDDGDAPLATEDKEAIKNGIVAMMTTSASDVQKQLSEAVSIISKHDFPHNWSNLLPELVSKLAISDLTVLKGVLLTINSIMKRFRYVEKNDALYEVLLYCLQLLQEPLTNVLELLSNTIDTCPSDPKQLTIILEILRLVARIFYSLNWQDIPEYFEDNLDRWASVFAKFLQYSNPTVIDEDEEDEPGPIESLQAAILENLNLYATKYEDIFQKYLGTFTQLVWKRLIEIGPQPKFDIIATSAIKFLNAVCSKDINRGLFSDAVLNDIVQHIVVRNLTATEADEEIFVDNPADYIRKDMEGSDQDTRRRAAMELVRSLMKFFPDQIAALAIQYIGSMLEVYRTTKDWKAKDAALHLILAVAVKSGTITTGASELNPQIDIFGLFQTHVLPELQDANINGGNPIIKADVLKLICVFRSQFDANFLMQLFPNVLNFLSAKNVVIQTYAALCIEKFLSIKDKTSAAGTPRIPKQALTPYFQPLFGGLFSALDNTAMGENEYVMKCIMRVLVVAGSDVTPVTELIVQHLTKALEKACKNPVNPHYNHYLFESLALLIRASCGTGAVASEVTEAQLACCAHFETLLFPPLQIVLAQDISEFVPYVFQILAQLLGARRVNSGLSEAYRALFPPLLSPAIWERKGNIPALVDIFKAYLSRGMSEIIATNSITGVLGIFQKLLSAKSTEVHAFHLLNTIFVFCPESALAPYTQTIFDLLLKKLMKAVEVSKTLPYCKHCILSMCIFATQFGPASLISVLDKLTPGVAGNMIASVWHANGQQFVTSPALDVKHVLVGATRLLTDANQTLLQSNGQAWLRLLQFVLAVVFEKNVGQLELHFDEDLAENREFDGHYSKLSYASVPVIDAAPEVADSVASTYVATTLKQFGATNAALSQVAAQLSAPERDALQRLLQ